MGSIHVGDMEGKKPTGILGPPASSQYGAGPVYIGAPAMEKCILCTIKEVSTNISDTQN
jgi:hypothetical protein